MTVCTDLGSGPDTGVSDPAAEAGRGADRRHVRRAGRRRELVHRAQRARARPVAVAATLPAHRPTSPAPDPTPARRRARATALFSCQGSAAGLLGPYLGTRTLLACGPSIQVGPSGPTGAGWSLSPLRSPIARPTMRAGWATFVVNPPNSAQNRRARPARGFTLPRAAFVAPGSHFGR